MSVLFAREGAHVACIDINKEAADDTVKQIASGFGTMPGGTARLRVKGAITVRFGSVIGPSL